jgi:RNA polymerase sigma-70 factor (ECF subfamily)
LRSAPAPVEQDLRPGVVTAISDDRGLGEQRQLDPEAAGDHIDRLYRAAVAICGSPQTAEDLVQETYVKVLSRPRFLRRDDDLGYLLRALRNTWYGELRRRGARPVEAELSAEDMSSPQRRGDPGLSMEASSVLAAVAALPQEFREVVAAVDVGGLSYAEAARALEIPEGTVMSRLARGRSRVAAALGPEAGE